MSHIEFVVNVRLNNDNLFMSPQAMLCENSFFYNTNFRGVSV